MANQNLQQQAPRLPVADRLTLKHTAFKSFSEMLNAAGGYFPSLRTEEVRSRAAWAIEARAELEVLANLYDEAQTARGDARRAYRS